MRGGGGGYEKQRRQEVGEGTEGGGGGSRNGMWGCWKREAGRGRGSRGSKRRGGGGHAGANVIEFVLVQYLIAVLQFIRVYPSHPQIAICIWYPMPDPARKEG